jgi:hypothetical protein
MIRIDLSVLEESEILELQAALAEETERRKPIRIKAEYRHKCNGMSNIHQNAYKHWAMVLTGVDITRSDNRAFEGGWLAMGESHYIKLGSVVVEVCDKTITAYLATANGMSKMSDTHTDVMGGFIKYLGGVVNG